VADLTDAQRKRAEAREQRRGKSNPRPADEPSDGAESSEGDEQPFETVVHAAKIAAAGAAVGAAAAAARALASHREEEDAEDERPGRDEEQAAADEEEPQDDPERSEPEAQREDQQQPEDEEQEPKQEPEEEPEAKEPVEGAALGDARKVASRAREQLEALLERPVESVSSLERTHDGWVVALEVVELSRVPESTDVLASYELELDEDLNFRRYQQARRYHRAQAERGEDA